MWTDHVRNPITGPEDGDFTPQRFPFAFHRGGEQFTGEFVELEIEMLCSRQTAP
jgi:hypothetical protein